MTSDEGNTDSMKLNLDSGWTWTAQAYQQGEREQLRWTRPSAPVKEVPSICIPPGAASSGQTFSLKETPKCFFLYRVLHSATFQLVLGFVLCSRPCFPVGVVSWSVHAVAGVTENDQTSDRL